MTKPDPPLIAHVIHHLVVGGMENGVVNLINRVPPHLYRHCVICVEDYSEFRDRIVRPDVQVVALKKSTLTRMDLYRRLRAVFRQLNPTIVHSRNLSGLDALLPAWSTRVPVRVHSEHGWDVDDLHGMRLRPRLLRRVHRPLVDHYVAVSKHLQRYLSDTTGVAPSRISQIYNGVDTSKFAPADSKPPGILPPTFYGDDKVVIGTVGRLQLVKDQLSLIRAFARMVADRPELRTTARLAIVGGGPLHDRLASALAQEGVADLAWLPGPRLDVERVYQCFDMFVLPSLNEGISNTLLEAMASGLPVVATRVGGNVELIEVDVNGSFVPSSDPGALATLLGTYVGDRGLRLRHGTGSRERATRMFSIEAMVESYVRMYDTLCAASTRSPSNSNPTMRPAKSPDR